MLGVTARDRDEIRIGRNRAIGAMYAKPLFWGLVWFWVIVTAAGVGLAVWLAAEVHNVWVGGWLGGLGRTVADAAPLGLVGLAFLVMFVSLARSSSPRRRRHHHRRRRR